MVLDGTKILAWLEKQTLEEQKLDKQETLDRIQEWLTQDDDAAETRSLLSRLCEECIRVTKCAFRNMNKDKRLPSVVYRRLERSGCSFILWADGHGVVDGRLDEACQKSRMLQRILLKLLTDIGKTLSNKLAPLLTENKDDAHEQTKSLKDLLVEAKGELQRNDDESESDESESGTSSASESTDWEEIADDMWIEVECLLDLESLIESPFMTFQRTKSIDPSAENSQPGIGCQYYSDHIRYRFPDAELELVDRLGRASWNRFLRVQESKKTTENDIKTEDGGTLPPQTEKGTHFHDSGLGTSLATRSAYAETAMSYKQKNQNSTSVKIPPMPTNAGNAFECSICGRQVKFPNNSAWKRHVFSDLRPWICHSTSCLYGIEPFQSREDWIQHLTLEHGFADQESSTQCPLCLEFTGGKKNENLNHISSHLEEISLSVLPSAYVGSECESESDSSGAIPTSIRAAGPSTAEASEGNALAASAYWSQYRPYLPSWYQTPYLVVNTSKTCLPLA
ncbi:hypothetical protein GCG54_00010268 [Colletotrichum gloeosporioides]|uniref:Oxidoreductase acuF-like C2H2 type zinc-finger domain-containing protein n=1 Tax=Colletotrichum gloeosporioides TaxID=474922 RepID=A0A8H4FGK1_COLGL|nr:uncharacterized protein GCG54_00010268 [Colletotrichum gloeosporioides]KAF3800991.1 hypothetical protein GCG54_00010268 [Colletotrichum gloeosporioides]